MKYKINIYDRNYQIYDFKNINDNINNIDISNVLFNPINSKLFNNDVFTYDISNEKIKVIESETKTNKNIPGILILNKTFGKYKNKYLYQCIPNDKLLPIFLIPYVDKTNGFSKKNVNIYVCFSFFKWISKHPYGSLTENIGEVNKPENFYNYQMYCRNLNISLSSISTLSSNIFKKANNDFSYVFKNIINKHDNLINRTDTHNVFTIDNAETCDYDDALSIEMIENNECILSIYITNVPLILNELDFYPFLSERVCNIYLPHARHTLFPNILNNFLFSLKENDTRIAFTMDLHIKNDNIINVSFKNTIIKVFKNFYYEEKSLLENEEYKKCFKCVMGLSKQYKYIDKIKNSSNLITYLSILMNYQCSKQMFNYENTIFRSCELKDNLIHPKNLNLPHKISNFLKIYNSCNTVYTLNKYSTHELLDNIDSYLHITSPIRKIVDLLNMINIQKNLSLINFSDDTLKFHNKWINKIEYINEIMKSIKKIQTDCNLLEMCTNNNNSNEQSILNNTHNGFIFNKEKINKDKYNSYEYLVYLSDLKIVSKFKTTKSYNNYSFDTFKIYMFNDQNNLKKKIRIAVTD